MINSNDQVTAAQCKESGFIEGIRNSEGLPFHWGVARFSSVGEAAPNHLKGVPGLSDWQKGSMPSVTAEANDTWFRRSRPGVHIGDVSRVWEVKVIAWLDIGRGDFKAGKHLKNTSLSGLRMMPLRPQMLSHSTAWKKLSVRLLAQRSVSSMHLVLL